MLLPNLTTAQNNPYYYYKGQKVFLTLDKSSVNLITNISFQKSSVSNINLKDFSLQIENATVTPQKFAKAEFQTVPSQIEFLQKINTLKQNENIKNVCYYYKNGNSPSIGTSNIFYIKLKNSNDLTILQQAAAQKNIQVVKQIPYMPLWYMISLNKTTIGAVLEISNQLYETGLFAEVDPAFLFDFKNDSPSQQIIDTNNSTQICANDPYFGTQWGLQNNVNPTKDINACQAWTYSKGNGVKIAVVDSGIGTLNTDIKTNVSSLSYNTLTGLQTGNYFSFGHGAGVASIIAAKKDNNLQLVGVAPEATLIDVTWGDAVNPPPLMTQLEQLASGISWAWQNGADVINNSWGTYFITGLYSSILENAINDALTLGRNGKGTLVVFASGNYLDEINYPANFNDNITTVGAIETSGFRWDQGQGAFQSSYGAKLDLMAPGVNISVPYDETNIQYWEGTSFAAPYVSGVIALMLQVNPCLTGQQVRQIIESQAQKILSANFPYTPTVGHPNGTWNNEYGHGLVNAFESVITAQGYAPLDLFIKDSYNDTGVEPNTTTQYMWNSSDIWIRNIDDNEFVHQNPIYSTTTPNYVHVRVTNKSCVPSTGYEKLKLHWAKAGTSLAWDYHWTGNNFPNNGPKLGDIIDTVTIPILQSGAETILKIPWNIPNPSIYAPINNDPWHFCLLARIVDDEDQMTFGESADLYANVANNNNIAWKNVTVISPPTPSPIATNVAMNGVIAVGNPYDTPHTFYLEMVKEDLETGKAIYDESEVSIKLDQTLFNAWEKGGKLAQSLEATSDEKRKVVTGNHVLLNNIQFEGRETGTANISFNFLIKELSNKTRFVYHVIQKDANTGTIIGGETYVINKEPRAIFIAYAGDDKEIDKNEPITISATQINEAAIYNWYDAIGNLVYQGKDLTIQADVAKKYKLEVIATVDGFKDYSEVDVTIKPSSIELLNPNPASISVSVNYKLNTTGTSYLMIIGSYGTTGTSNNYLLDENSSQTTINIVDYPNGFYTVALVCNGQIVDAKTLIKN